MSSAPYEGIQVRGFLTSGRGALAQSGGTDSPHLCSLAQGGGTAPHPLACFSTMQGVSVPTPVHFIIGWRDRCPSPVHQHKAEGLGHNPFPPLKAPCRGHLATWSPAVHPWGITRGEGREQGRRGAQRFWQEGGVVAVGRVGGGGYWGVRRGGGGCY